MTGIYARVSTEEQARSGYSLQDQIRACRKLADDDNIVEYIDEGISGEILDRPFLTRLRSDIREGKINKVVCLDPDRLSRKLVNQLIISEEIEKYARLVFINGEYKNTPEGKLFYQLRGAISEFEKAKINERMSRGRKEKARQGYVVRDYKIYGYDYEPKTKNLIINQFESEIVKTIFRLFTETDGKSSGINGIAQFLNKQGIPTKRGAPLWHRQVVRQILCNRTYIGEFYQNRWNTEGILANKYNKAKERIEVKERPEEDWILVPCPPIIDEHLFSYAQEILTQSRRRWAGVNKHQYLLGGILRCGICSNTMTGRQSRSWGKLISEYTDVKGTAGTKNKGCGKRVQAKNLDKLVWDAVLKVLNDPQNIEEASIELQNSKPVLDTMLIPNTEKKLSEIKKERLNLIKTLPLIKDDLGDTGLDDIRQRLREFKEEEEKLGTFKLELESRQLKAACMHDNDFIKQAAAHYLSSNANELPFEYKRQIIRHLVKEIIIESDEIKIFGF